MKSRMPSGPRALEDLSPELYDELRSMARRLLRREQRLLTIRPTDLVHEYLLKEARSTESKDQYPEATEGGAPPLRRKAARAMMNLIVDHARAKTAQIRGGADARPVSLTVLEVEIPIDDRVADDLLDIHDAFSRLDEEDAAGADMIRMRMLGYTYGEMSKTFDRPAKTIERRTKAAGRRLLQLQEPRPKTDAP